MRTGHTTGEGRVAEGVELAEQAAVEQVRDGDHDAYAVLVRMHVASAYRAATLFGPAAEVEDVVQTAFLKAFSSMSRFEHGAAFRPWLMRIVINEAKNAARSAGRRRSAANRLAGLGPGTPGTDPVDSTLSEERRRELLAAVQTLPAAQQQVIACRFFLDLDERETAAALGLPVGTVKSRLHRALRRLRARLGPEHEEAT
jgi:RNA polymerase sigma factor (sigma-70 family)